MQLSVHTTTANEHDSKGLRPCLENQDKKLAISSYYTDKRLSSVGYPELRFIIKEKGSFKAISDMTIFMAVQTSSNLSV
jgi:hypothetical protein